MRLLYIWKQCLSTTNISTNAVGGVLHGNKQRTSDKRSCQA